MGKARAYEAKLDKSQFNALIGRNVRKQRIAAGYKLEEVSDILGLSVAAVGMMERGDRGMTSYNLFKVASIFGVSPGVFYEDDSVAQKDSSSQIDKRRKTNLTKLAAFTGTLSDDELEYVVLMAKNLPSASHK